MRVLLAVLGLFGCRSDVPTAVFVSVGYDLSLELRAVMLEGSTDDGGVFGPARLELPRDGRGLETVNVLLPDRYGGRTLRVGALGLTTDGATVAKGMTEALVVERRVVEAFVQLGAGTVDDAGMNMPDAGAGVCGDRSVTGAEVCDQGMGNGRGAGWCRLDCSGFEPATDTWFVRTGGSDDASGRTPLTAFATIGHAAAMVQPGDTVLVGGGTYLEDGIRPGASGRDQARIVFLADTGGVRTLDDGPVVIDADGGEFVFTGGRDFLIIDGFELTGSTRRAVNFQGSIESVIRNSVFYSIGDVAIWIEGVDGCRAMNNLIIHDTDATAAPIRIKDAGNTRIGNNTIFGGSQWSISVSDGSSDISVINNIITGASVALRFTSDSATNVDADHNLLFSNTTNYDGVSPGPNDVHERPMFVEPTTGRFELMHVATGHAADSAAIDAGRGNTDTFEAADGSTRVDRVPDTGRIDIGFHYPGR